MKIESLARPGLMALGLVGLGAAALLGFAAGVAVTRDPQALRRTTRQVARAAAVGIERATLVAAQAREHMGDLWAEARDAAVGDVDEADFERAAAKASRKPPAGFAAASAEEPAAAPKKKPARKRTDSARKPRAANTVASNGRGPGTFSP